MRVERRPSRAAASLRATGLSVAVAVAGLALLEGVLAIGLRNPGWLPEAWLGTFREYYLFQDRAIVQYDPACARYDAEVTYRLRAGECRFRNREFDTTLRINQHGYRDDAASLDAPAIVVIGDSHAMGWGVEQEETFPQRLEALLGRRVLNASVSSYGTARELQALRGVDLSALEWLVVQYSRNDVLENAEFELSNGRLAISSRDDYEAARASIERATAYFPGKHVGGLVGLALRGAARWESTAIEQALARYSPAREAHLLLRALSRADLPWARLRLLFVEINGRARNRPAFANALRRQLAAGRAPLPAVGSYVLSSHELVGEEHYYVLDDHMRPEGHRRIAEAIARRIADE